jgi:HAD superfamily hydrolase (TIGR01484 family)
MKNISALAASEAKNIKYILMDIDDTLTTRGKLPACAFGALWKLHDAGLVVVPVTGRPAGWCDMIAREWPCDGVVGENGALVFYEDDDAGGYHSRQTLKHLYHPNAVKNDAPALVKIKERALAEVPGLRLAKDQFSRLFDIALDFAEEEPALPLSAAEKVKAIAESEGLRAKISSIHVNVWLGDYDKLSMAENYLARRFGWNAASLGEVFFAGDSPNDEPMFARFPLAAGVANVKKFAAYMKVLPTFAASNEGGEGFAEIAEAILEKRR